MAQFAPNAYGLYDVAGNAWEWVQRLVPPRHLRGMATAGAVARNPKGPPTGFDPAEPGQPKRVHRGGSYLCTDQYCTRYMVGNPRQGRGAHGQQPPRLSLREADQLASTWPLRRPSSTSGASRRSSSSCRRSSVKRLVDRIEALFAEEGDAAGAEFKQEPGARRLANLVDKGAVFVDCILEPRVLALVGHVLGPRFKLSSLNARAADPGEAAAQPLHADVGAVADELGLLGLQHPLHARRLHRARTGRCGRCPARTAAGACPRTLLADPRAPHPDEVLVTGRAGDVVVMNAHLWHGGTANRTHDRRLALHAFYCRSDKPQQQYQKRLAAPRDAGLASPPPPGPSWPSTTRRTTRSAEGGEGRSGFMK